MRSLLLILVLSLFATTASAEVFCGQVRGTRTCGEETTILNVPACVNVPASDYPNVSEAGQIIEGEERFDCALSRVAPYKGRSLFALTYHRHGRLISVQGVIKGQHLTASFHRTDPDFCFETGTLQARLVEPEIE